MTLMEILLSNQDVSYQAFQRKLIPNIPPETILGIRTPCLRTLAKKMPDKSAFLTSLPHSCFEENQIHAFILENEKHFCTAVEQVGTFLPYVDNSATCDQLRPRVFRKHKEDLLPYIQKWLSSSHTYTIRFAIDMLMCHYLDDAYDLRYPQWVSQVSCEDYYVKMMQAWYFATALAKQYDTILPYLSERRLEPWVHKKTIQKAVESYRISPDQKVYLKTFR